MGLDDLDLDHLAAEMHIPEGCCNENAPQDDPCSEVSDGHMSCSDWEGFHVSDSSDEESPHSDCDGAEEVLDGNQPSRQSLAAGRRRWAQQYQWVPPACHCTVPSATNLMCHVVQGCIGGH